MYFWKAGDRVTVLLDTQIPGIKRVIPSGTIGTVTDVLTQSVGVDWGSEHDGIWRMHHSTLSPVLVDERSADKINQEGTN